MYSMMLAILGAKFEYAAYGNCTIMDSDFEIRASSLYNNPYSFQGKRLDLLSGGDLELMHWPYRDYSTYLGRWLQSEKLGMIPNDAESRNPFNPPAQYTDGLNLYESLASNPVSNTDAYGLYGSWGWPEPKPAKPWAAKCGTCGPSVTVALGFFGTDLQADYYRWPEAERKERCAGMWNTGGWDILELTSIMSYPDCGTCDCAPRMGWGGLSFQQSVEVYGKCYDAFAVNYYMWGVMNRLCKNSKTEMLVGLIWPKFVSGDYQCKKAWALAGFDLNPAGVSISSCPKYAACKTTSHISIGSARPWAYKWRRSHGASGRWPPPGSPGRMY